MTEQEIEQQARESWDRLNPIENNIMYWPQSEESRALVWEYYLKAWQDACKVLYTEQQIIDAYRTGKTNGYEITTSQSAVNVTAEKYIEQLKQSKQQ